VCREVSLLVTENRAENPEKELEQGFVAALLCEPYQ
jgi:hypothetical protein